MVVRSILLLAVLLAPAMACRPAPVAEPTVTPPADPLDRARLECAAGVLPACDEYELQRALCLQFPDGPPCNRLRELGEIPPEPPPLADAFGCRPTQGPIGPHAVICLAEDRLSIRDAGGRWEQWKIEGWQRDDTARRVIWVASVIDGASLWLTLVPNGAPASPLASMGPPVPGYHVVGSDGLLHATLGARDSTAEDQLRTLPGVEEVCRLAKACEEAVAAARRAAAPPRSSAGGSEQEAQAQAPAPVGPHTLQACHERWSTAAYDHLARGFDQTLPSECGTVRAEGGWAATPIPPYEHPDP